MNQKKLGHMNKVYKKQEINKYCEQLGISLEKYVTKIVDRPKNEL